MSKAWGSDIVLNPSTTPSILAVIEQVDPSRRRFLHRSASVAVMGALGGLSMGMMREAVAVPPPPVGGIGFTPLAADTGAHH